MARIYVKPKKVIRNGHLQYKRLIYLTFWLINVIRLKFINRLIIRFEIIYDC